MFSNRNSISSSITGGYVAGRHATYEKEVFPEFTQSFQELTQQLFEWSNNAPNKKRGYSYEKTTRTKTKTTSLLVTVQG